MNPIISVLSNLARGFLAHVDKVEAEKAFTAAATETKVYQVAPAAPAIAAAKRAAYWEDVNIEDLPNETWASVDLIQGREVFLSNMGRLKAIMYKGRNTKGALKIVPARVTQSNVFHQVVGVINTDAGEVKKTMTLQTAKSVLSEFSGAPDWAKDCPNAYERSGRVVHYKNGNYKDCSLQNLSWASTQEAQAIEKGMLDSIKFQKSKKEQAVAKLPEPPVAEHIAAPFPDFPVEEAKPDTEDKWVDVDHFVGYYQIRKDGAVRSLDRYIHRYGARRLEHEPVYLTSETIGKHDRKMYRLVRGVVLTPVRKDGELTVTLCRDGLTVPIPVAALLIETFASLPRGSTYTYEYIDGDLSNCCLSNLRLK